MSEKQKRRDKGDGSIFPRMKNGNEIWVAELKIGRKEDGTYNTKTFYAKNKTEVKRKLDAYKETIIKNGYAEIKKITVQDYLDNWLYNVISYSLKPTSFDIKESILKHQVYPNIGGLQIAGLTTNDIQNMINQLISDGFSYSTIKKAYDALNACFKLGLIKGDIIKNPCLGVVLPKNMKKNMNKIEFFNDEDIEKICTESIREHKTGTQVYRLGYAIIFLLNTGLRIGETIALTWDKINFEEKMVLIDSNAVFVKDRNNETINKNMMIVQDSPKTNAGNRVVYLNNKAIFALDKLKEINGDYKYVISNSKGNIANPRNFNRMFHDILVQCNIDKCGVHTLRHTFASKLIRKGIDIKTVSELLGHATVSITYNTYIHLVKQQKQIAVSMLDDI